MDRFLIPGSQWLYMKIYTGPKTADTLLTQYLYPMTQQLKACGLIEDFFFIRYSDPKFHIRFRMRINDVLKYGGVFQTIYNVLYPSFNDNIIYDLQFATYERELERYGETTIIESEQFFCVDSEAIINVLAFINTYSENTEQDRWRISLLMVDDIFNAFGYQLEDKSAHLNILSKSFKQEFNMISKSYTKQLNDKYRDNRSIIEETFHNKSLSFDSCMSILDARKNSFKNIITEKLIEENHNSQNTIVHSYIHMTINRIFRSKNRLYEMVIYDFLNKYYQSKIAILNNSKNN